MTSPLQLLTSLGFPGVARMIRAGRIGRKGAIDQVWHAYKVRDVERESAVAASDAIRAYFVQKDARVKAVPRGTRANPASSKVKIQPDVYGSIIVSDGKHAAIIHPAQKFLTVFGQYIEGHFSPDRMKKTRTYLTLAAAQRAATRYVEQARSVKRNPTTGSKKTAAAFGKAVLSSVKALVKGATVTLDRASGSLIGRGGWDAAYNAVVTVAPTSEAPFSVNVSAKTAEATRELPAQTTGTVDVNGAIGAMQRRPDADVLAWAKKIVSEARPVIQAHAGIYRSNPATAKPKKPRKVKPRTAYNAQAYHFDAASWDRARVIKWLNRYGYKSADVQLVGPEYIAPQHESWDYEAKTLHRVQVAKHVEATVGVPLAGSDAASAPGYNKRFGQVGLFPKGKRAPKKAAPVTDGIDWTSDNSPF